MNIAKVTYEDKEAIQNDETIAEKNKVTANNMNQIKKAINDNADFLTEVKNTVDELNGDVGNIKIVQTAQNSTISNMNNAIEQNSKEIYENSNNIIALQKENTALKEELKRQKEDNKLNGLTEDNEGEMLHITNTTGARFNLLEIFGNEKQKTREGYNKLENHLQSQTINGVNIVINSDKSITLNGTATAFFQLILLDTDDTPIILSPKTYTMSLKGKILGINFVGTENGVDVPYLASTVTTESVQKTYQSETTITKILCAISQGTQLNNVKLYPMIYEGTDEKEYEEYGAMPSFDYPSEIKTVENSINLKICNKNFLEITAENQTLNGVAIDIVGNKVTLNGTATKDFEFDLAKNFYLPAKNMFVSFKEEGSINAVNCTYSLRNADNKQLLGYNKIGSPTNKTILANDLGNNMKFFAFWITKDTVFTDFAVEIQIEEGNTSTGIVAHEEQNYVIPVQQRMFSGDKFVKVDGIWKEMHTMGTVYSKDVSNIVVSGGAVSGVEGFYRYNVNLQIANRKGGSYIRILSNYFKYGDSRWNNKEGICGWENGQSFSLGTYNKNYDTADKLKEFLTENNVEFDYELAEPLYLDCTKEQIEVLDKIEKEAHTYEEVTNIYTEDEIGAIIKTNTNVDLKSLINNIQEQLIAE